MDEFEEHLENIRQHILDASNQNWLFGAGISRDANIPLMYPLTDRVCELVDSEGSDSDKLLVSALKNELPEDCHVEHYLSHLGDLIALAERTKNSSASVEAKARKSGCKRTCLIGSESAQSDIMQNILAGVT